MKKLLIKIVILFFTVSIFSPITALGAENSKIPDKPYEKVVAKSGTWYTEALEYNGQTNLVVGYTGSWDLPGEEKIQVKVGEKSILSAIFIPFKGDVDGDFNLSLIDDKGNVYKGLKMGESNYSKNGTTIIFSPEGDVVLAKGQYTLLIEGNGIPVGKALFKGYHFSSYIKYQKKLIAWEQDNEPDKNKEEKTEESFGESNLASDDKSELKYGEIAVSRPPTFALDDEYQIDEIIVSTYNDGEGALPGKISIIDDKGKVFFSGQSYGTNIGNIPNSAWKIALNIVLPAGIYKVILSQPEMLSYDQDGEPLFYVKASLPIKIRKNYTGTYQINLDSFKTSTLMGPVLDNSSSFSLRDFELTILDKGDVLEVIGQYENMPFSQNCEIIEEAEGRILAQFDFKADLTKLPYQANILAEALITISGNDDNKINFNLEGIGIYDRPTTDEKGGDYNTYNIRASGMRLTKELPLFVMTALGKASSAGNIPGPDNGAQAAVGILFPPLVGVVVNVLQEMLKPKVSIKKGMRDKDWYKEKYPNSTDDQIATIMLADAMGNTDNPDEGDSISIGDNEHTGAGGSSFEGDYDGDDYESEPVTEWQPEDEFKTPSEDNQVNPEYPKDDNLTSQEPETIVIQTSASGGQTLYVKDPKTGEWVDPETNSVLDIEKHSEALEQMKKEQEWSNKEFEKISKGESENDRVLWKNMEDIKRQEEHQQYENIMKKKYGTDDLNEIHSKDNQGNFKGIINEQKKEAEEWAKIWKRNDKVLGTMEVGAVVVGTAADVGIDGLALVTPGGTTFRTGYKVLKGVAGTMGEAGAKGKEVFNLGNLAEGTIKGGADAALDYVPGSGIKTIAGKAGISVIGETVGSGAGAALRGENVKKSLEDGFKGGAYKATVGAVTDKMARNLPNPIISRGSFKAIPNMKNVIISKAGGTKVASTLADEYIIKPIITGKGEK